MKYIFTKLVLLLVLFAACERDFELELPDAVNKIAVFAPFSNQEPIQIQLSRSQGFSIDSFNVLVGAQVNLYENGNFIERLENVNSNSLPIPIYQATTVPRMGNSYELEVFHQGSQVRSLSRIPGEMPKTQIVLESISKNNSTADSSDYIIRPIFFLLNDPEGERNFYHLKTFQEIQTIVVSEMGDTSVMVDLIERSPNVFDNDNNMVKSFDGGMLFSDEIFDGNAYNIPFWFNLKLFKDQRLGKLHSQLRTVSKEYYLYYTSLSRQITTQGPPENEPVLVYNNVENGLGLFGGYAVSMDSIVVE